jgi:hypothetical protein
MRDMINSCGGGRQMNLFDVMRGAGEGDAFSALAAQFGLSQAQVAKAAEAFLPAFSAAVKKSAADPLALTEFMRRLAAFDYVRAYRDPAWAAREGRRHGEEALTLLFGSPAATQAVARQASEFAGLAQEKLAEMLPALSAMLFGGLVQQSTAANPFFESMLKAFRPAASGGSRAKGPLDRYEEEQEKQGAAADLAKAQAEMAQAGMAAFQAGAAAWQQTMAQMAKSAGGGATAGTERPEAGASGQNPFGDMLEPGLRFGEAYRREMETLVERLRSDAKRS